MAFSYDVANDITGIVNGMSGSQSETLGYDALGRLTGVTSGADNASYAYDADGNGIACGYAVALPWKAMAICLGALLPLLFVATSCVAAETVTCPETVRLDAATVHVALHSHFSAYVQRSGIRLSGLSVFDGPPSDGAALVPSAVSRDESRVTWVIAAAGVRNPWVACDYAQGLVRLARKITGAPGKCVASMTVAGPGQVLRGSFKCE